MPQSPRRNSQTQTNWADHLSAHRYAAGAVVALLAAYVVAGRGEPQRAPIPPGATLVALEAWVHLFPFREAHTHTCIAPHGLYRSGEYDDEASELRHRRERLLALRRARAAAADVAAADGV